MKRIVWTFGIISGIIVSLMMVITLMMSSGEEPNFENGELLGYTSMIIALSVIFFAVRSFRNRYNDGVISFGKAFTIGLYITLIASALYVLTWMIYSNTDAGDQFMDQYMEYSMNEIRNSDKSPEQIEIEIAQTQQFMELYDNPLVKIGFTFLEVFPVGLIISLICAAILKRSEDTEVAST